MDLTLIAERERELLEDHCDFVIGVQPSSLAMLPESDELELVAGDGMGGCFYEWRYQTQNDDAPIVYLSQYGETSRFASDLKAAVAVVAAYPGYWGDVLTAGHKSEELMLQVINRNEAEINENELEAVAARTQLRAALPIADVDTRIDLIRAIRTKPEFRPTLDNGDGTTSVGASFGDRPFPRQ